MPATFEELKNAVRTWQPGSECPFCALGYSRIEGRIAHKIVCSDWKGEVPCAPAMYLRSWPEFDPMWLVPSDGHPCHYIEGRGWVRDDNEHPVRGAKAADQVLSDDDDAIPLVVTDSPTRPDGVRVVTPSQLSVEAVARYESALGQALSSGLQIAAAERYAVDAVLRYGIAIGSARAQGLVEVVRDQNEGPSEEGPGEGGSEDPTGNGGPAS